MANNENKNEWFGIVRWCDDDIANAIETQGYEPTEENIAKVRNAVDTHHFVDWMIENGWEYIYQTVDDELN